MKSALLFAAALLACTPLAIAETVARIMGQQISMEEISPPAKELTIQQAKLSPEKLAGWLTDYRHQRLAGLIWKPLRDDFCKDQDCKATDQENDELTRSVREGSEESTRERREELPQVKQELKSPKLSKEQRRELLERKRVLESLVASADREAREEKEMTEKDREEVRKDVHAMHAQFVEAWKFNRALHRKYGGRIIFQQAGIEPLDAYRQFLEEHEKKGSFEILDSALRKEFWKYYTTMEHTYLDPGDADFDTPWWKQKRKADE